MTSLHQESRPGSKKIDTGEQYIESLRGRDFRVFLFGELAKEPVDHPLIRPRFNVTAERYELAVC